MSVDSAFQRLRDANPVPHPAALRERPVEANAFLVATQQRSTEMQTELEPPTTPKASTPRWRTWVPVTAATVVLVVVGLPILLSTSGTDPAAPQDIAASWIEARDAWDAEAALALMAPDAVVVDEWEGEVGGVENLSAFFDILEAIDWRWTVDVCTETAPGPPAEVTCTYTQSNAWARALEVDPSPGIIHFVVADGEITELTHEFDVTGTFNRFVWSPWTGWSAFDVPLVDKEVMYDYDGDADWGFSPESIALWEKYTNEFVASVTES